VPAPILASPDFNAHPRPLTIPGTRETHPGLFDLLEDCGGQEEAAEVFAHYMELQFGRRLFRHDMADGPRRFRVSYLDLLLGWGVDSSSPQGAVLKGWVESRFGLSPIFHKERLGRFPSPAWIAYLEEKMSCRFHNNAINFQLDLLYEYAQWSMRRFGVPRAHLVHLWRGTNDYEDQVVIGRLEDETCEVWLNNLVSFTLAPDQAEAFGDWVLETDVPTAKILLFPGLLQDQVLRSEGEVLVIGGRYRVVAHHGYL